MKKYDDRESNVYIRIYRREMATALMVLLGAYDRLNSKHPLMFSKTIGFASTRNPDREKSAQP